MIGVATQLFPLLITYLPLPLPLPLWTTAQVLLLLSSQLSRHSLAWRTGPCPVSKIPSRILRAAVTPLALNT